jgi:hypothetical protein
VRSAREGADGSRPQLDDACAHGVAGDRQLCDRDRRRNAAALRCPIDEQDAVTPLDVRPVRVTDTTRALPPPGRCRAGRVVITRTFARSIGAVPTPATPRPAAVSMLPHGGLVSCEARRALPRCRRRRRG